MISVVYMGTPEFAVPPLQALIDSPHCTVLAVFTNPDRPVGRKQILTPPPVKVLATTHGIPVYQPASLKGEEVFQQLSALAPDFLVVAAYGHLIPQRILDIPKYLPLNIHGSLLPKYRGASPIQSALLHGEKETGVTFMQMTKGLDEGDMLRTFTFPITEEDTAETVSDRMSALASTHLVDVLLDYVKGEITHVPQDHGASTHCTKLTKEMGEIHPTTETSEDIFHKFQAFTPWPGIFFFRDNKRIKLLSLRPYHNKHTPTSGIFLREENNGEYFLSCQSGSLLITHLQMEGKKVQTAEEFFRSFPEYLG